MNLLVLIQANQLAFSQTKQPYDFYVLVHAADQLFTAPSQLYVHQDPGTFGAYWSPWLWYGASYLYAPWFAVLLSPLASVHPPTAKLVWVGLSYALLVASCALTVRRLGSMQAKFLLPLLVFIMPLQLVYSNQTLPQYWLHPKMPGMWISPVFFADYYWGNTNTMILALGLLAYCCAVSTRSFNVGRVRVPSYVFSALFLALDSFKIMAPLFVLPFWLAMNRSRIAKSIGFLFLFICALNAVALFEPALLVGYLSTMTALSLEPSRSPLWQVYEYVWYYTLPIAGLMLLRSSRANENPSPKFP